MTEPGGGETWASTSVNAGGLGFLLDRIAHSLSRAFADVLAPFGLTATGLGLLSALMRFGPLTQSELAVFLAVERQQALHLVDGLEHKGWVRRVSRPGDRRVWDVEITPAGRDGYAAAATSVRGHEVTVFASLSTSQRQVLAELLGTLAEHGRYPLALRVPSRYHHGTQQ